MTLKTVGRARREYETARMLSEASGRTDPELRNDPRPYISMLEAIEARRERIATACLAALVSGADQGGFIVGPELVATAVCLADDLAAALDGPRPKTAWDDAPLWPPQ